MNWAHVHLMINHFPVIGVMGAILLFVYALVRKSEEVKMVSLGILVLLALITIPVYVTGGAAADVVQDLPGVAKAYIGKHDDVASIALLLMELLGIFALAGLVILRRSGAIPKWIIMTVLALSLVTAAVMVRTANLGGQIRHTEIREGSPALPTSGAVNK